MEPIALPAVMRDGPVQILAHTCVIGRSCGSPAYASRITRASAASVAFGPRTALPSSSVSPAPFTPEPVSRGGMPSRTQPLADIVYPTSTTIAHPSIRASTACSCVFADSDCQQQGSVFAVPTHHVLPLILASMGDNYATPRPCVCRSSRSRVSRRSVRKEGEGHAFLSPCSVS